MTHKPHPDFARINTAALLRLHDLLVYWLPEGRRHEHEYLVPNPLRTDERTGTFSVDLVTGRWADFARDARGSDPISLAAYLSGLSPFEAARRLARILEVDHD